MKYALRDGEFFKIVDSCDTDVQVVDMFDFYDKDKGSVEKPLKMWWSRKNIDAIINIPKPIKSKKKKKNIKQYRVSSDIFTRTKKALKKGYLVFQDVMYNKTGEIIQISYPCWCWCIINVELKGILYLRCIKFGKKDYKWYSNDDIWRYVSSSLSSDEIAMLDCDLDILQEYESYAYCANDLYLNKV